MLKLSSLTTSVVLIAAFSAAADEKRLDNPQSELVPVESVNWGYLNPLRGDKSPGAANLWGDRTIDSATGMLVRFKPGFSSPAHIHNISYRGIVIKGLMHNDDPNAELDWMATGSFWTQPAGQNHITAAKAETNLIYLEIDEGPYLVKPSKAQFNNGEHSLNLHSDNMVWFNSDELTSLDSKKVTLTPLWQKQNQQGVLVKLDAGFNGQLTSERGSLRAVLISGELNYRSVEHSEAKQIEAGSYFSSVAGFKHQLKTEGGAIVYVRFNNKLQISEQ